MAALPQPRLTDEQYLAIERAAPFRSEFYKGQMYAMSGASYFHGRIIGNLTVALYAAFGKGPCSAIPGDLRVRVSPGGLYTYPDVVVVCEEPRFADDQKDTLLNPVLLIEVLSPSTEGHDRGFKSAQYRSLGPLQEYALVWQNEPHVEVFRRQKDSGWLLSEYIGMESQCRFESTACSVALSDIYERVTFTDPGLL
jgi:Uma2 family endonuclease